RPRARPKAPAEARPPVRKYPGNRSQYGADLVERARILDRRQVARIASFAQGHDGPAQDLARTRLGQAIDEQDARRAGDGAIALLDDALDLGFEPVAGAGLVQGRRIAQDGEGHGLLALELI